MPGIKMEQFGGMLPAWNDHLLPQGQSSLSVNSYLLSGAVVGWRTPKLLRTLLNGSAAMVYRVPTITQATASANLIFLSNVNAGDAIKVGEETYTFTATVTNPYDVLRGATATDSANNLYNALLVAAGVGTLYGNGTCPNPAISQVFGVNIVDVANIGGTPYPWIYLAAPDSGAAFNTTVVTETTSNVRLTWLSSILSLSLTTTTFTGGVNAIFDNQITGNSKWLEFVDPDTNVMRSPVVNDKFGRYYFASPALPPQYNTYNRIQADQPAWLLGLNPPGCAPGVTVTGGGDLVQLGFPNSTSGSTYTPGPNTIYFLQVTPDAAMELEDISFMPAATSATARFSAVLYDDQNGSPFELLNVGTVITGCDADVQVTSQFQNPTGLLANVKYWIGIMMDTAIPVHNADATSTGKQASSTFSNGPPAFVSSPVGGKNTIQLWADLNSSSVIAARSYVYTWVSEYGEESPPSPPTLVNGWSNGTWTIDLFTPPPDDMGVQRNIKTVNLYRTVVGTGGTTVYFFVATIPVGTTPYVDNSDDNVVALNNELPSTTWFPPPEGLEGIQSMPNGMTVGFRANELWFAEPYQPHAWPPNYVVTTEFPIVGLGVTGQAVIAATNGTPYIAQGVNPANLTVTKLNNPEPCVSRGSIISRDTGVYYISPNGLIKVDQYGAVANTTEFWITRERWRELTPDKNIRAIPLASSYFAFGTVNGTDNSVAQQGFTIEMSNSDAQSFTIWPQPGGHRVGFHQLTAPNNFDILNVLTDPWSGTGLLIQNGAVYYYDFKDQAPTIMPYKWRSKKFLQQSAKSYSAMKIYFEIPPGSPALSADRNEADTDDPSWNTLAANQYGIVRVYGEGDAPQVLVTTREFRESGELLRIGSGAKYDNWQIEIESRVKIYSIQVATSVKELANL